MRLRERIGLAAMGPRRYVGRMLSRAALWIAAATFLFFGVAYALFPDRMTAVVGIALPSSTARADVRAVYGGLEIAIGALLAWAATKPSRLVEGLFVATVLFAGLFLGRVAGALVDGEFAPTTLRILGGEGFAVLGCGVALLLARRSR